MAINLWKVGGKPTAYNPLPLGSVILPLGIGQYVIRVRAKSALNGKLYLATSGETEFLQKPVLTSEFKTFEYSFRNSTAKSFWLSDNDSKGDIIIETIELVRKPLPARILPNKTSKRVLSTPKTGLAFNGVTGYLQLPSMTMDSIEIECLIPSDADLNGVVLDARAGAGTSAFTRANGVNAEGFGVFIDGVVWGSTSPLPTNRRMKVKYTKSQFTDDVTIFSSNSGTTRLKGILYKVTCYLNGAIVGAPYDFENPANIVGDKIIPNAKNLIPSFEDSRWSLHANAKVLGKDILRLDATAGLQTSFIDINVEFGKSYLMVVEHKANMWLVSKDVNKQTIDNANAITGKTTTYAVSNANVKFLRVGFDSAGSGAFDFIKPQLYQLDGKEGTIVGNPTKLRKESKRNLYSKR